VCPVTRIQPIWWSREHIKCVMKDAFMNDVENDRRKSGIVNWRQIAPYGDGWKRAVR
jgi:hypothetical protein